MRSEKNRISTKLTDFSCPLYLTIQPIKCVAILMMDQCERHPRQTANVISRLSFFYNFRIFLKGYRKTLERNDLYQVLPNCKSKNLGDELEEEWRKQKSIRHALWTCYGRTFIILGLLQLVARITKTAWQPEALSKLVSYFSPGQSVLTKEDAVYYGCVVIGLNIFELFFYYNFMLALTQLGIRVRTSVCSLLYRKSLTLSSESLSAVTVGKIVTIMTKDVEVFFDFVYSGNDVWIPLVQTGVICYLIYSKIGVTAFAGVAFYFMILPLQMFIGKMSSPLRLKCSKKTDQRLELLQEVLSAIKVIKMYTWEKYFERKIHTARKMELAVLFKLIFTKVWIIIIGSICSKAAFFIFLVTYVYLGNPETNLTAETVYYILSCCSDLEYSLSMLIPLGLSYTAEAYATTKRIDDVLAEPELPPKQQESCENPKIFCDGISVKRHNKTILEKIHLDLEKGLHVVTGNVGSGKTTLLKTILQEFASDVQISGTTSYASQEPWLFPSTIRNNIIFGEQYNELRYQEVLRVCDLQYDIELLSEGDETVVGDRGLNLSKGQQTRINLARAVYKTSDIYLLDDSLASLDVHVSQHIFEECILGFLNNKICVFVSNNSEHVAKADSIILVNNGVVKVTKTLGNVQNKRKTVVASHNSRCEERPQVYHETKKSGKVSLQDYRKYVSSGGNLLFGVVLLSFLVTQVSYNFNDKLLSNWITLRENLSNIDKNYTSYETLAKETDTALNVCTIIAVLSIILVVIRCAFFYHFTRTASINLHKVMTKSVINTSMTFFDLNFLGTILNRFSKDCHTVDESLAFNLISCLSMAFMSVGSIVLLTIVNTVFLVESILLFVLAYLIKRFCQPTGRNLQRLNVATRSPMVGHLNASLGGLTTIRASNAQNRVIDEFDTYQDCFTSANYMLNDCQLGLGFGLELFCNIFTALVIIQLLVSESDSSVGDVGLAITQSFVITGIVSSGVKSISEFENLMTSVERIVEYTKLKKEKTYSAVLPNWPTDGKIKFDNVTLDYDNTNCLKNVSFVVKPEEKLGIVGRTGAGKSSIISSLLRLYQIQGDIHIDDINTANLPVRLLRSNISIIPQDPFLFSGTIRENLDPFLQYRDEQIWKVLEQLRLKAFIDELDIKIDKGATFSAGQKQLLSLARAVLRKNRIVVLDEVTANVDQETEVLIQEVVNQFENSTVIIVAHKLESILKCDKVLVMNEGRIAEFGEPVRLLENKDSFLYNVIQ